VFIPQFDAATSLQGNDLAQSGLDAYQELPPRQKEVFCLGFEVLGPVSLFEEHSKNIIKSAGVPFSSLEHSISGIQGYDLR
jgi:hypothetical protein